MPGWSRPARRSRLCERLPAGRQAGSEDGQVACLPRSACLCVAPVYRCVATGRRRQGAGHRQIKKGFVGPLARRVSRGGIGRIMLAGDVDLRKVMNAFKSIGYQKAFTAEIVPGMLGAVEKALAALKIIEKL